jgi:ATP-dependent RNA helicase DeaD
MTTSTLIPTSFDTLGLNPKLIPVLAELGYESATQIQAECIPVMMAGGDLLGQASTGTGKTAAFALPIISGLDESQVPPQALVLTPTRELAIQVSEAFHTYAKKAFPNFRVLPIYGGTDYRGQLTSLKRGVHVVVGTPGRILDHLRRGTLVLSQLKTVVLDEADEMLNMGFLDDVKEILKQITVPHQVALFSATMPNSLRSIVQEHLKNPTKIHIKPTAAAAVNIEQFYTIVSQHHKLEVLTRYLEIEDIDGTLIFTRTKLGSDELADKLEARGYSVSALNGDMTQSARENVMKKIKNGDLDIIVATEVAARGLDVDRINHVINYDIPQDVESYTHRIGRTGRAGRKGKALLFVTPRETRMLRSIEQTSASPLKEMEPPSVKQINLKRAGLLSAEIGQIIAHAQLDYYRELVEKLVHDHECSELDIAAAFASLSSKAKPMAPKSEERFVEKSERPREGRNDRFGDKKRSFGDKKRSFGDKKEGSSDRKSSFGDKKRSFGDKPSFGDKKEGFGDRKNSFGDKKRSFGDKPTFGDKKEGFADRKSSFGDKKRSFGDKPTFGDKKEGFGDKKRSFGDKKPTFGDKKEGFADKKSSFGDKKRSFGDRKEGFSEKKASFGDKKPLLKKRVPQGTMAQKSTEKE